MEKINSVKYFNVVKSLEISELRNRKKRIAKNNNHTKYMFSLIVGLVLFSFVFIFLDYFFECEWLGFISLSFLLLAHFVFIFIPVIKIYNDRFKIKRLCWLPFNYVVNYNIKSEVFIDVEKLFMLMSLNKKELEFGLMEIKHERHWFEKRISIIIGPMGKLGILPGIITTLVSFFEITGPHSWVSAIAYGYIILLIASLGFNSLLEYYDKIISLTEVALKQKMAN